MKWLHLSVFAAGIACIAITGRAQQPPPDKNFTWHQIGTPEISIDHVETRSIGIQAATDNPRIRASIVVRCSSNRKAEVLAGLISNLAGNPDARIKPAARVRFDNQPPYDETWSGLDARHNSLFAATPGAMVDRFKNSKQLYIEFRPENRTPVLTHFDMTAFADQYHQACEVWE